MTRSWSEEKIAALVDGSLEDEAEAEALRQLLERDPEARAYADQLRRANALLRDAYEVPADEPTPAAIQAALLGAPGKVTTLTPRTRRSRWLPPAIAAGALRSVQPLKGQEGGALRARHQERARTLMDKLRKADIPFLPSVSHIVPVMVCDPVLCKQASDLLLDEYGIYVQPINYPTVPKGTERLRITPTPLHTDEMMDELIAALAGIWDHLALERAA